MNGISALVTVYSIQDWLFHLFRTAFAITTTPLEPIITSSASLCPHRIRRKELRKER